MGRDLVYNKLLELQNNTGQERFTTKEVAMIVGVSERNTRRALNSLVGSQELERVMCRHPKGRGYAVYYTFTNKHKIIVGGLIGRITNALSR